MIKIHEMITDIQFKTIYLRILENIKQYNN